MSATNGHTNGHANGNGTSNDEVASYSIPRETQKLFIDGIVNNPLIGGILPAEFKEAASHIKFVGSDTVSIPINWRFAESISSLKGLEAAMVNVLLKKKYDVEAQDVVINTYVDLVCWR